MKALSVAFFFIAMILACSEWKGCGPNDGCGFGSSEDGRNEPSRLMAFRINRYEASDFWNPFHAVSWNESEAHKQTDNTDYI
jgi:hypothetical protein